MLQDVSLQVERGEFVVLLGPSGCGKSTIQNLIAGFESAQHGRILSQGAPCYRTLAVARHGIPAAAVAPVAVCFRQRPGRIREQINVPVAAGPRDAEVLAADPVYRNIKAHALHLVRNEARRNLALL